MTTAPTAVLTPVDLLFAGTVFCDLVFAGVMLPEPGAEVYATDFTMSPGGVATRAVAGARLGSRTALLSQLGDDFIGQYLFGALSVEPNLDVGWLRRQPGFRSPVTVSLTGQHERQFITYQEPAGPLEWSCDRPPVAATHVSIEHDLPAWVGRLRGCGTTVYGGVGWDPTGLWSARNLGPAVAGGRLRAQRGRGQAVHRRHRRGRRRPRPRSAGRTRGRHSGRSRGRRLRQRERHPDRGAGRARAGGGPDRGGRHLRGVLDVHRAAGLAAR